MVLKALDKVGIAGRGDQERGEFPSTFPSSHLFHSNELLVTIVVLR